MKAESNELIEAYLAGLDASLWWGKFSEFLYGTAEGEAVRKELQKDFLTWQVEELGRDPHKGLLSWQKMWNKLFPDDEEIERKKKSHKTAKSVKSRAGARNSRETKQGQDKTGNKRETVKIVSKNGVKKPKAVAKPRKIELKKESKSEVSALVKSGNNGVRKTKGAGSLKGVKNKNGTVNKLKEMKFKGI